MNRAEEIKRLKKKKLERQRREKEERELEKLRREEEPNFLDKVKKLNNKLEKIGKKFK